MCCIREQSTAVATSRAAEFRLKSTNNPRCNTPSPSYPFGDERIGIEEHLQSCCAVTTRSSIASRCSSLCWIFSPRKQGKRNVKTVMDRRKEGSSSKCLVDCSDRFPVPAFHRRLAVENCRLNWPKFHVYFGILRIIGSSPVILKLSLRILARHGVYCRPGVRLLGYAAWN